MHPYFSFFHEDVLLLYTEKNVKQLQKNVSLGPRNVSKPEEVVLLWVGADGLLERPVFAWRLWCFLAVWLLVYSISYLINKPLLGTNCVPGPVLETAVSRRLSEEGTVNTSLRTASLTILGWQSARAVTGIAVRLGSWGLWPLSNTSTGIQRMRSPVKLGCRREGRTGHIKGSVRRWGSDM